MILEMLISSGKALLNRQCEGKHSFQIRNNPRYAPNTHRGNDLFIHRRVLAFLFFSSLFFFFLSSFASIELGNVCSVLSRPDGDG